MFIGCKWSPVRTRFRHSFNAGNAEYTYEYPAGRGRPVDATAANLDRVRRQTSASGERPPYSPAPAGLPPVRLTRVDVGKTMTIYIRMGLAIRVNHCVQLKN